MPNQPKKEFWLICPVCKGKTRTRVQEDSVLANSPLFCPKCKAVTRVHYVRENMILREDTIAFPKCQQSNRTYKIADVGSQSVAHIFRFCVFLG